MRRYVGDADDAYDLVQEAFISSWLALQRFDVRQSFSAWLRAIALNKCRDYARRRAVRQRLLGLFAAEHTPSVDPMVEPDPTPETRHEQRLRQLDRAIAALPRRYKEPLLLTMIAGLTQQQAAEQLKTTTKAIEMRIRRAKRRLAEALSEQPTPESAREG